MSAGRLFRANGNSGKEPDFIRTSRYDGRKSVDFDKFFADPVVKERMEQLRNRYLKLRRGQAASGD